MAATSEIVEVRDELDILRHFHRSNRLRLKLRATESQCKSSHAYPSPNSRTRLTDAIDFNTSPVLLSREIQQRSKLKKPLEVCTSRGASRGLGASESPSLKQALRKLCISHASEMAATRRSVTIEARNLLDKGRSNAIETPKVLRDKEIVEERNGIKGKANSKASVSKGKQEAVPALGTTIRILNLSKICRIHCKTKPDSIGSSSCNNVAKENLCSREKGECSQSSKSSLGDYSSSTSMSEGSSCFGSSTNCNRPHMSKDVRWAAVHSVVMEQGSLGVKNFKLVRRLGYGDIGTVYLAELINTGCLFALKVMDIELLVRRRKMIRVQTEREIMQILDHPFLPTLYAYFAADNLAFLVMEYCPGGDLHILRQKQPGKTFQEPAARFYVAEVLLTLEYLHMLGVIYRDLKPENILVREDGHIMLSDFDLSLRCNVIPTLLQSSSFSRQQQPKKSPEPRTQPSCIKPFCLQPSCDQVSCFSPRSLKTYKIKPDPSQSTLLPQLVVEPTDARSNSFVGTHEYLAPEIIRGDGHGSSVDWWTLGIFLYELLFGRTPFKGSGNEETLSNVVSRGLSFPQSPAVGHHVKDLIRGLLRKDPESRLGSVKGAAEIKQHPFFEGLNWALIRCAAPPEVPRNWDEGISHTSNMDGGKCISFRTSKGNLELKLF